MGFEAISNKLEEKSPLKSRWPSNKLHSVAHQKGVFFYSWRESENRVERGMLRSQRKNVKGSRIKVRTRDVHDLYSSTYLVFG